MGKRELVALLSLSSLCVVILVWLFLVVPWVCLQLFVIVIFPDNTQDNIMSETKSTIFHLPFSHCQVYCIELFRPLETINY